MTALGGFVATVIALAAVNGLVAAWLAGQLKAEKGRVTVAQDALREAQGLIVKLASRESKPESVAKVIGENARVLADGFNQTLTRLMIGYQTVTPVDNEETNMDRLPNNMEEPKGQWLPSHETLDPLMFNDIPAPLMDIPRDGPGGWVGAEG